MSAIRKRTEIKWVAIGWSALHWSIGLKKGQRLTVGVKRFPIWRALREDDCQRDVLEDLHCENGIIVVRFVVQLIFSVMFGIPPLMP